MAEYEALGTLQLARGAVFTGTVIEVGEAPHYRFGTREIETAMDGTPKTVLVVRLRPEGAGSAAGDVKFWARNRVKARLLQAFAGHSERLCGGRLTIRRLQDKPPTKPGWNGEKMFDFQFTPGPERWVDPLKGAATDGDDDPF